MTQDYKPFIYSAVILTFIIVIGAGHGIGCIGMAEIISFPYVTQNGLSLSLNSSYNDSMLTAALFSAIGQVLLYISLWMHNGKRKLTIRTVAIILLWTGFFYLTRQYFTDSSAKLSFWTGTPFLLVSLGLSISTMLNYKNFRNLKIKKAGVSDVRK